MLLLAGLTAGCARPRPVIYLDDAWNTHYARNTCYMFLPQRDRDPQLLPCLARQTGAQEQFTRDLRERLVAEPACAGVVFANPAGRQPAPAGTAFWRLLVSMDDLTGRREPWDLLAPGGAGIRHGAGDAAAVARAVCGIAGGRSGPG